MHLSRILDLKKKSTGQGQRNKANLAGSGCCFNAYTYQASFLQNFITALEFLERIVSAVVGFASWNQKLRWYGIKGQNIQGNIYSSEAARSLHRDQHSDLAWLICAISIFFSFFLCKDSFIYLKKA